MKKLLVFLIAAGLMLSFAAGELSARAIIIKGGYAMMQNDLEDIDAENTWTFGVFFDMGTFIFNSLKFKPGLDWVSIETSNASLYDIWGIHFDWYWYFMGNSSISPFLGFGPSLNYKDYNNKYSRDKDSDAGVDLFAGAQFGISGTPFELILEARYRFIDIADRDENIFAILLGLQYKF